MCAGDPIKAYVMGVCHDWNEVLDNPIAVSVRGISEERWTSCVFPTKDIAYSTVTEPDRVMEFKTHWLQDDVMALYRHHSGVYWFFWISMSGRSDLGRFKTGVEQSHVVTLFEDYVRRMNNQESSCSDDVQLYPDKKDRDIRELPIHAIRNGLRF